MDDDVRKASEQFYAALNRMAHGDAGAMADIWSQADTATTMHPIGGREVGWENVKGPWEQIAKMSSGGQITLIDRLARVAGDMAYEVGVEQGHITLGGEKVALEHRVTNVYRREGGNWKIVHHRADLSPAMVDLLSRLQRK